MWFSGSVIVRSCPWLSYVNVVLLPAVCPLGGGVVVVSRFPFTSYVFVVVLPSGSVAVSTSSNSLYVKFHTNCAPFTIIDRRVTLPVRSELGGIAQRIGGGRAMA